MKNMILKRIEEDCREEFISIRSDISYLLRPNYNVEAKKDLLKTHLPGFVISRSELLLDTVINYMIEESLSKLQKEDIRLQNKFFEQNFRQRTRDWAKMAENEFLLHPSYIEYSKDPRWVHGFVAGGIVFIAGSALSVILSEQLGLMGTILLGIVTLIASGFAFRTAFANAETKAREMMQQDIERYLNDSEKYMIDWLSKVVDTFGADFASFCKEYGLQWEGFEHA